MPATKRKMDFANVKEGGVFRPRRKPEGDYEGVIVKVDDHQPKDKSKPEGWVFTIKIKGDERSTYPVYASPEENQAWKVRKMFIAAGIKVPKKLVLVDPNKLVGKAIGVALEDDEYEGRMKSTIADFMPVDDIDNDNAEDEYDDEEEVKSPKSRKKSRDDDDDEDEEAPAKSRKRRRDDDDEDERPATKRRRKPEPEDDDEEDDEDEEEKPRRSAKKATSRKRKFKVDDDEDDDLDLDEL